MNECASKKIGGICKHKCAIPKNLVVDTITLRKPPFVIDDEEDIPETPKDPNHGLIYTDGNGILLYKGKNGTITAVANS